MIPPSPSEPRRAPWLSWLIAASALLAFGFLLFSRAVDQDLNHDEHQFLAPAALLSREALLPWRDFPLFHLPNLVHAYAAAERSSGDLILGAKLLCFLFTFTFLATLCWKLFARENAIPLLLALGLLTLFFTDPLFLRTTGKTWNHEIPTALLLASAGLLAAALRHDRLLLTLLAGICAGLAAGCRLTFAPPLAGLFFFILLCPLPWRRRTTHAAALVAMTTAALAPTFLYLAKYPEAFLFGNFEFPRLRLSDPANERIQKTVSWLRKFRFLAKEIIRESWPLFLLWAATAVRPGWQWLRTRDPRLTLEGLLLFALPFVLLGCFAPARYQHQHFYVFVPWLVVAIAAGLPHALANGRLRRALLLAVPVVAAVFAIRHASQFDAALRVFDRQQWFPEKARAIGEEIRAAGVHGRVLTLAPAFPLQTGLPVYPEFATGTFAWRSAHLVPSERRKKLHLIAPEDLSEYLAHSMPAGILTGVEEDKEEAPLIAWAQQNGYKPIALRKKRTLWVPSPSH